MEDLEIITFSELCQRVEKYWRNPTMVSGALPLCDKNNCINKATIHTTFKNGSHSYRCIDHHDTAMCSKEFLNMVYKNTWINEFNEQFEPQKHSTREKREERLDDVNFLPDKINGKW